MTGPPLPHITICICTRRRCDLLNRLLHELARQKTQNLFTYSIVVADNDPLQSAHDLVTEFGRTSSVPVVYCTEGEPNIAKARNKALEHAAGDLVACIDDDEIPEISWLHALYTTLNTWGVDGVLGPVRAYFEHEPPRWVVQGGFFERTRFRTGHPLHWSQTRTGNLLFRREILNELDMPFRPEFGTGSEDLDFFQRVMRNGRTFVWCDEAPVYELVPPSRCRCSYVLRRAVIQAGNFPKVAPSRARHVAKAAVAIPVYALALPFLALLGRHRLIWHLEKLSYHLAYILSSFGYTPKLTRG